MMSTRKGSIIILAIILSLLAMGVDAGASVLTVTDPGQPSGISIASGMAGTLVGQMSLSVDTGSVVVTGLKVSNSGTAVQKDDIFALSLYADANDNGSIDLSTDLFLKHSYWNSSEAHYVFSDLALEVTAGTSQTLLIAMHAAAGAEVGSFFTMNVNDSGITLDGSDTVNPFTIMGNSFTFTESPVTGNADGSAPMVIIINPANSGTVSGDFLVQIQVHNSDGLNNLTSLELSTDSGSSYSYSFDLLNDRNLNYNVGSNAGIYETVLTLPPAGYTLVVRAQNSLALEGTSPVSPVLVNLSGIGDGHLLRRDNSDQFCADCHALQSHSSQSMGRKYGSWGVGCRDCHTPHNTTNIYLIKEKIVVPNFGLYSGTAEVRFWEPTGVELLKPSYANPDNSGPCQVCHTRTQGADGSPRWRNTGNSDTHYSDSGNPARCTDCHLHSEGFKASLDETSPNCYACHMSSSGGGNDLESYTWGDGLTAMIDLDEWLGSGHGRDTSYDSGNYGAGFRNETDGGCLYCHDEQIVHNEAGIAFFRLKDQGPGPSGTWGPFNGTCLICHASEGSIGYQPVGYSSPRNSSIKVDDEIHDGEKHDDDHSGGRMCWDCHDPHGDDRGGSPPSTALWYMIQRNPVKDRDETTMAPSSLATTVSFQSASSYIDYTSGGLCVNCHSSTDHYPGFTTDDHPNDDYGITERCTNCHLHNTGFQNVDNCPGDPAKTDPGICGCGTPDTDGDGDGFYVCDDCDDADPGINPDTLWYRDSDGDGFGTSTVSLQQCYQPPGPPDYVLNNVDYDDNDPSMGPPLKIGETSPAFYLTLQEAYNNAGDMDVIQCVEVTFIEDLSINIDKSVVIEGGYDAAFSNNTSNTILNGDMNITNGTLTVEGLTIQ